VSRDPDPEQEPVPEPPEPEGRIGTTGPGPLLALGLVGLVLGWALRPVAIDVRGAAPTVGWVPVLALFLVAVIVGATAWATHRSLHVHGVRLPPHQAVNRLVLAKSCALAGALVAGAYFGYALSWVGVTEGDLAGQRLVRSVSAGVASVLLVAASLALERACRVGRSDDENLR
jgi:hypothetical protein